MLNGLNFKEFVAFLSAFSSRASLQQKVECKLHINFCLCEITSNILSFMLYFSFSEFTKFIFCTVIFKVYDSDGKGKVSFYDMLEVLRDLTGQFISEQQREVGFLFY